MIISPLDAAEWLAYNAKRRDTDPDQQQCSEPRLTAGLVPSLALFTITTVEGRTFRVQVTQEL